MRNALRLGSIAGIEIRLDYSWFIVFALVTWSLGAHYFPTQHPGWPNRTYWTLGLITAVLFFASVLIHELAHSLVARSYGTPVRSITLFIFGGAAEISEEPKRAREEFAMALVGPATSLVLAALFGLVRVSAGTPGTPLVALATWLSGINLMLAVFNLIPGFPLDGGRVLRSIVWGITGSLRRATQIAAGVGRFVAFGFIFWGIWTIFGGNWVGGLWIAFIGWFLENAATASSQQVALRDVLAGHTASEVMTTDCPHIASSVSIDELVHKQILPTSRRCFPVLDGDRVEGIVTLHHVREVPRDRWAGTSVEQAMTPLEDLKKVRPDDGLFDVLGQMTGEDVNQLPVVDDGKFLGMVSRDTVLAFIQTRSELGM